MFKGFELALSLRDLDVWKDVNDLLGQTTDLKEWCDKKGITPRELPPEMKFDVKPSVK